MKQIFSSFLLLNLGLAPAIMLIVEQPVWGQTQISQQEKARQLLRQGLQHSRQGKYQQALDFYSQALSIFREIGDFKEQALTLNDIGLMYKITGNPQKSLKLLEEALSICQKEGYPLVEAKTLANMGVIYGEFGQIKKAIESYEKALPIHRQFRDRVNEAMILNNIGWAYKILGEFHKSSKILRNALTLQQQVNNPSGEALTLNNLGLVSQELSQFEHALKYHNQALEIVEKIEEPRGQSQTLTNLGDVYRSKGELDRALEHYNQALGIVEEIGDLRGKAVTLNNIGVVYKLNGENSKALDSFEQALSIFKQVKDPEGQAGTLNNIGSFYASIGDFEKAKNNYNKALSIQKKIGIEIGNDLGRAVILGNIAEYYLITGQPQKALNAYQEILATFKELKNRARQASALNNIGGVYQSIGNFKEAHNNYTKALKLFEEIEVFSGQVFTLNNLGENYRIRGERIKAETEQVKDYYECALTEQPIEQVKDYYECASNYYERALKINEQVRNPEDKATILNNFGLVDREFGRPIKALKKYERALSTLRKHEAEDSNFKNNSRLKATIIGNIALIYQEIGQFQNSLTYYKQASSIVDQLNDSISKASILSNLGLLYQKTNQIDKAQETWEQSLEITLRIRGELQRNNRESWLKKSRETKIALVALLIRDNQPERAFEWANLVTTFALADYNRLIGAKVANSETQKAIDNWNQQNQQLQRLRNQLEYNFSENLARRLRDKEAEVFKLAEDILNRFPDVAELFESTPTDIAKLQQTIPKDTLVIQPVLLTNTRNVDNTIAFFLVTQDSLKVIQHEINPEEFNALVTTYRNELATDTSSNVFETSNKLYQLLIAPIEAQLKATSPKKLAIIATGKLRYIPFETLRNEQTDEFLIQTYPIHYLTRISTNQSLSDYSSKTENNLQALALANPKPFLFNTAQQREEDLKGTEIEANFLQKTFPGSKVYKNEQATLDTFETQAFRFPLLHLGTHGCFDPKGCPNGMEANTILFANNEQYHIRDAALLGLTDTEIIVLSACQTAKEAESDALELSGLAFVLERAGAKSVMASLWKAEDTVSAGIMTQFYTNLKQGMSKSEALRQAKLSHLDTGKKRHPVFWSPFILIGDGE